MKKKKLILLTSEFPYGKGETFLETEISFLAKEFDEVLIISSAPSVDNRRELPDNVTCELVSNKISRWDKLKALFGILSSDFQKEKRRVQEIYQTEWTQGVRNTALIALYQGRKWHKRLTRYFAEPDFDTVFYSYWCTNTALGLALLRRDNPTAKVFSRVHGWDLYFEATAYNYQPFRGLIGDHITGLFPISDKGTHYIRGRWKVEGNQVQVARLGTREMQRNSLEIHQNSIVSCSSMIPLKRVHLIAESLKHIDDIQLNWYHFGDGPERATVEKICTSIDNENINVHFMGHVQNAQVLEWYRINRPDLFVNVSTTEGIPVSIMEAMSFGIPVLATNVGGTGEIVNDQNGSLLSADITASELAKKIQDVFRMNESERNELIDNAYETWKTRYNAQLNYSDFAKGLVRSLEE